MDWPSLLVGALLGLATNLATPPVQRALNALLTKLGPSLHRVSGKHLRKQLKVLQDELETVERLRANPAELIARVAGDLLSLALVTWIVLLVGYFAFVHPDGSVVIPKWWQGALGGLLGASLRYVIAALATSSLASHAAFFDEYSEKNRKHQERLRALLPGEVING